MVNRFYERDCQIPPLLPTRNARYTLGRPLRTSPPPRHGAGKDANDYGTYMGAEAGSLVGVDPVTGNWTPMALPNLVYKFGHWNPRFKSACANPSRKCGSQHASGHQSCYWPSEPTIA